MQYITRQNGCLEHDDRIDALAGALKIHLDHTAVNLTKEAAQKATDFLNNWQKERASRRNLGNPFNVGKPFFR